MDILSMLAEDSPALKEQIQQSEIVETTKTATATATTSSNTHNSPPTPTPTPTPTPQPETTSTSTRHNLRQHPAPHVYPDFTFHPDLLPPTKAARENNNTMTATNTAGLIRTKNKAQKNVDDYAKVSERSERALWKTRKRAQSGAERNKAKRSGAQQQAKRIAKPLPRRCVASLTVVARFAHGYGSLRALTNQLGFIKMRLASLGAAEHICDAIVAVPDLAVH